MKYPHLENIPAKINLDSGIVSGLTKAHGLLGELKGTAQTIPSEDILINTLPLLESKSSSEIEQIITTHDDIFVSNDDKSLSSQAKEVQTYAKALQMGCKEVQEKGFISVNLLINIANMINSNDAGVRKQAGTSLKNEKGDVVYMPPQNYDDIIKYMFKLESFINADDSYDPLIKMAMIHYYFETIHPFYDGNGRVGRILNILYLIKEDVLYSPILYLSGSIINDKANYYKTINNVTQKDDWSEYVLYILTSMVKSCYAELIAIYNIKILMDEVKEKIKSDSPRIYSHEFLNTLFIHPYVKTEYIENNVGVTRQTASKYLKKMVKIGILELVKRGNINYYVNRELINIFKNIKY